MSTAAANPQQTPRRKMFSRSRIVEVQVRETHAVHDPLALPGNRFRTDHDSCRNYPAVAIELGPEFQKEQSWASDQREAHAGRSIGAQIEN